MPKKVTMAFFMTIPILLFAFLLFSWQQENDNVESSQISKSKRHPTISPELINQVITPFNKGVALMEQYKSTDAVKEFEKVVQLAPDWITGQLNLGIALLNAEDKNKIVRAKTLARAEKAFKWVIEQEPDNSYAHYALGMLYQHLNLDEDAITQFQEVLRIDPGDADTHYQMGFLFKDRDTSAAIVHFEKTLARKSHHEKAALFLHRLLERTGEKQRAQEMLKRHQILKYHLALQSATDSGKSYGMEYGKMGRYASVIRAFGKPVSDLERQTIPAYTDIAKQVGLTHIAPGTPNWPGEFSEKMVTTFGPGIAVADVEGENALYYITGLTSLSEKQGASNSEGILYHYRDGQFFPVEESGINGKNAIGAYFGDYDVDGDPDLYLTCIGPNRLYRNEGNAKFTDVTAETGTGGGEVISVGAAWTDADHDGDLDLYVANFSSSKIDVKGVPNFLWRNNKNGTFTEVATKSKIDGGNIASMSALFVDIDDDRDTDLYLINHNAPNQLFLNDRAGQYTKATSWFPEIGDSGPGLGALLGDVDMNGKEDILLLKGGEPPRLFLQIGRGHFIEDSIFKSNSWHLEGASGGLFGDIDLDGDLDLILLSAMINGKIAHRIMMNNGIGYFEAPVAFGEEGEAPASRGAVAVDIDQDGSLELIVTRVGATPELWKTPVPENKHWLTVIPAEAIAQEVNQKKSQKQKNPVADGLMVEVKSGQRLQVASVVASSGYLGAPPRRLHFGLGNHAKADYVRLFWSDAILQSELEVATNQSWLINKKQRKASSCPILFVWDGERFAYVTDFLGVGGVGFFIEPGVYAPPDPTEDIRIPPELVATNKGRYLIRIAEPLEEVTYLDQAHLVAYDHPEEWEVYPDERFTGSPPFPTAKPLVVADKIFPKMAKNHHGENVLKHIQKIDRQYVEPPKDKRFVGYADDHWIELDFGKQLQNLEKDASLTLYLYGWVEYTYSHINYAAYQAGITMRSPWIEVPDGKGGWRIVTPEMGFPAGLPRMMSFDISSLPIRKKGLMRIRTNMEIFWDQIFIGENISASKLQVNTLQATVAELRYLGYPREFSPDGNDPTVYDYQRLDMGVPFKNMTGDFTRFGDVRELLKNVDDQFVIMARGEEIALEFDASTLPKLPKGWSRTLVLHSDGYCKDMDIYTAEPDTVNPLPYHAMKNYPPAEPNPNLSALKEYQRVWNTRRIVGN
ncbi:FG-GAP-like repeat-containing protein [Candidatus Parabeggiatoa sp. HSG14]|uniref:FG-GAP-like repeat-containing protein n=1 Tax=Candidatus Parabeggiatoa sp. HSG14 TaxID=3055593 RepID=UPI0025A7314F|nr:FG-GAP-like repeat-containing protein [Thiotrichales bacterium HSG14]